MEGCGPRRTWHLQVFWFLLSFAIADGRTGKFWHVSDFHYDFSYAAEGWSCNEFVPVADRGVFGDYWCDSPWFLVQQSVAAMMSIQPNVDFVIWTGDNVLHTQKDMESTVLSEPINLDIMDNITDLLYQSFGDIPVYPALGNHDFFPDSQSEPHTGTFYDHLAEKWKIWINSNVTDETLRKGGYYSWRVLPGLRVISLNTILHYSRNLLTEHMSDPADHLAWLDTQLQDAEQAGDKVMIIAHICPGVHTPDGFSWLFPQFRARLREALIRYKGTITAVHCGHEHSDEFRVVYDEETPVVPMYFAPSVTPWRFKIPTLTGMPHNPGIRLVTFNTETGEIDDIFQYYLDLRRANSQQSSHSSWDLLYQFTAAYDVNDGTAESLGRVYEKMSSRDNHYMDGYLDRKSVHATPRGPCDDTCKDAILCGMRHLDLADYEVCISTADRLTVMLIPMITLCIICKTFFQ